MNNAKYLSHALCAIVLLSVQQTLYMSEEYVSDLSTGRRDVILGPKIRHTELFAIGSEGKRVPKKSLLTKEGAWRIKKEQEIAEKAYKKAISAKKKVDELRNELQARKELFSGKGEINETRQKLTSAREELKKAKQKADKAEIELKRIRIEVHHMDMIRRDIEIEREKKAQEAKQKILEREQKIREAKRKIFEREKKTLERAGKYHRFFHRDRRPKDEWSLDEWPL